MDKLIKLFELPVNLSKHETDEYFEVEGLASCENQDLQGEIVRQNGFDLSELQRKKLVFNDNHSKETKDIIGVVDNATITKHGLYVRGKLFKNNASALTYYNLLKHGSYVGFSVEGYVKNRDSLNKTVVKEAKLLAIALTRNPVNEKTFAQLAKSLCLPPDATNQVVPLIEQGGLSSLPPCSFSSDLEDMEKGKHPMPDGVVVEWQGKHYTKKDGKWFEITSQMGKKEEGKDSKIDPTLMMQITSASEQHPELKAQIQAVIEEHGQSKPVIEKIHEAIAPLNVDSKDGKEKDDKGAPEKAEQGSKVTAKEPDKKDEKVQKALVTGGPQYTGPPGDITGGSALMTESNENSRRNKRNKIKSRVKNVAKAYKKLYKGVDDSKVIAITMTYFKQPSQQKIISELINAPIEPKSIKTLTPDERKALLKSILDKVKKSYPSMSYNSMVKLGLEIYHGKIQP